MHLIRPFLLISLLLVVSKLFSQNEKQSFIIKINGKEYKLQEGEEVTIDSSFNKLKISVSASPYKTFEAEAISFQYPKNMAANFEKDLGIDTWTLFEIKLAGQKSRVIIFQDSVSDFNSSSEEQKAP